MKEKTNEKLQTPYELFGVECGDGWKGLLKPIFDYIEKYNSEHTKNPIVIEQVKEKFGCYDKETEVLTNKGWKYFSDVQYDDYIMCLEDGYIKYRKPTDIIKYHYNGKMYHLVNRGVDIMVTPNHNLYISKGSYFNHKKNNLKREYDYELATPDKYFLKNKKFLKKGGIWEATINENIISISNINKKWETYKGSSKYRAYTIKGHDFEIIPFLKFLGFYVAEGYSNSKRGEISITYNPYDEEDLICNLLNECNITYANSTPGIKKIYSVTLATWLCENCGHLAYNKKCPQFIKNLPKEYIKIFLEYLYIGDGHKNKTSNILTTTSKLLSDDVQELLLKAGYAFRAYKPRKRKIIEDKKIQSKHIVYEVNWLKNPESKIDMSKAKKNKSYIERYEDYDDYVYCVTVPKHIIYVRRNGKGYWCGNSLRFYVNFETEELSKLIEDAECDSWETCELCGSKEHIGHTTGWVMTICHDCIKKNAVGRKNDRMWIDYANDKKYIISHDENISDKEIVKNERNVQ